MEKKKKKDYKLYIPTQSEEEAGDIFLAIIRNGDIKIEPFKRTIPESVLTSNKSTLKGRIHDYVKAAQAYLSNRGDADITDDKFFELIREDAEYLRNRFAIEKIKRWQQEAQSDNTGKAQDKLRQIGEVLAEKRSKKKRLSETQIVGQRWEVYKKLKDIGFSNIRSNGERSIRLKALFDEKTINALKKKTGKPLDRFTDEDLADFITAELCKVSASTVKTYRKKKVWKVNTGFPTPAFIMKKVD